MKTGRPRSGPNNKKTSQQADENYRHMLEDNETFSKLPSTKQNRHTSFIEKTKKIVHAKSEWNPYHLRNFGPVN